MRLVLSVSRFVPLFSSRTVQKEYPYPFCTYRKQIDSGQETFIIFQRDTVRKKINLTKRSDCIIKVLGFEVTKKVSGRYYGRTSNGRDILVIVTEKERDLTVS